MVEHGGFYRTSDQAWVRFERIQFVGACNPPTDPGRKPLSHRSVNNTHCTAVNVIIPCQLVYIICDLCFHVIPCDCLELLLQVDSCLF